MPQAANISLQNKYDEKNWASKNEQIALISHHKTLPFVKTATLSY